MKRFLLVALSLFIGCLLGWYIGYTRPLAEQQRYMRGITGMTDRQMAQASAEVMTNLPAYIQSMKREDDITTALALGILKQLDRGNVEGAKRLLIPPARSYYLRYHASGGNPQILAMIEEAKRQHSDITADSPETK